MPPRELREEIELEPDPHELRPLRNYTNLRSGRQRHVFVIERYIDPNETPLHEGAAIEWHSWDELDKLELTAPTRDDLDFFRNRIDR